MSPFVIRRIQGTRLWGVFARGNCTSPVYDWLRHMRSVLVRVVTESTP